MPGREPLPQPVQDPVGLDVPNDHELQRARAIDLLVEAGELPAGDGFDGGDAE